MTHPRVVLVVADVGDHGGRAAAHEAAGLLDALPGRRVALMTGDRLASAGWMLRVARDGATRSVLDLGEDASGRVLVDDDALAAVWFRSSSRRPGEVRRAGPDADYARAETDALLVAWLASLGTRAVNPPDGLSPTGPSWSPARWRRRAAEVGMPTAPDGIPTRSVLVAGGRVCGAHDAAEAARAAALGVWSGCRALDLLLTDAGEVTSVSTVPDVTGDERRRAAADLLLGLAS